jgi:hypothetical protein
MLHTTSISSVSSIINFVKHIEDNIYTKELIYRSILIVKNEKEAILLQKILQNKDHSVFILNRIDDHIDYNNIDIRIMIISYEIFEEFMEYLDKNNGGILNSSYNFLGFSYGISSDIVDKLIEYYVKKTMNNSNNTIILEKNNTNFIYLQQCVY